MKILAQGSRAARERAMRELYRRYAPFLLATSRRLHGGRGDPEVSVSRCFERVWRAAEGYEPRGTLRSWLYRILFNLVMSELGKKAYFHAHVSEAEGGFDTETAPESTHPDAALQEAAELLERQGLVTALMASVSDPQAREAAHLRFVSGLSEKEVMEALDIPRSRLVYLIRKARRSMLDALSQADAGLGRRVQAELDAKAAERADRRQRKGDDGHERRRAPPLAAKRD